MNRLCRSLVLFALAVGSQQGACQNLVYTEPGIVACPVVPVADAAAKTVQRGASVSGSIRVTCGFDNGSYTVTLNSSDAGAVFVPKTFLVNFGRIVGSGAYKVRFSSDGLHSVSATITSNMGSPVVHGHFASAVSGFKVVQP